jgi:hypothetical protein
MLAQIHVLICLGKSAGKQPLIQAKPSATWQQYKTAQRDKPVLLQLALNMFICDQVIPKSQAMQTINGSENHFYWVTPSPETALRASKDYFRWICWICAMASFSVDVQAEYNDHITCAVYHRMLIGNLKSRGLDELTYAETEKMNTQIDLANLAGDTQFESFSRSQFNQDWAAIIERMTDQINSNYGNVYLLKARYQTRCKALQQTNSTAYP